MIFQLSATVSSAELNLSLSRHLVTFKILIVCRDLIDQTAVRQDLHNAVCSGLHDLMVTGGEKQNTRELDQSVVQRSDRLHVQMVGRLIQKQNVCAGDHHLGEQAAYALSAGENIQMFYTVLTGEKHTSKESTDVSGILDFGKLSQPVNDCKVRIELFRCCPSENMPEKL